MRSLEGSPSPCESSILRCTPATTAASNSTAARWCRASNRRARAQFILEALQRRGFAIVPPRDIPEARLQGVHDARVRRLPARRLRALDRRRPRWLHAAERLSGARAAPGPSPVGHQRRDGLVHVRRQHADRRRHLGRRARRRALGHDRGGAGRRGRSRRLCAVPPAGPSRRPRFLRRLLLPEQRGARRAAPARPRLRAGGGARRRLPPRQRHAGDLLGARRRAVRVAARRRPSRSTRTSSAMPTSAARAAARAAR